MKPAFPVTARRMLVALLLALALANPTATATESAPRPTGASPMSDAEFLAIQEVRMVRRFTTLSGKPDVNLPPAVDLSPDFPPVGKQLDNTCPGWAMAYAIKSYHEKLEHGWAYGPNHLFSPTFLTNLLSKNPQGSGIRDFNAYFLSIDIGAVPLSLYPYIPDDDTPPSTELIAFARAFRNLTFRRLPEGDLLALKATLAGGDPVFVSVNCYAEFWKLDRKNPVQRTIANKNDWMPHFLVVVGYDDRRHAIKLYNSWGTEWGDGGMGWVDYDLCKEVVFHPIVVYDRPTPPEVVRYLADPHRKPTPPLPSFDMPEPALRKALRADDGQEGMTKTLANYEAYVPPADLAPPAWKAAPADEPVLVVPEEAGLMVGENWLRLGDPLPRAKDFFSEKVSPRFAGFRETGDDAVVSRSFMDAGAVGRIDFTGTKRAKIMTNRGISLGTPRDRVHQVYRKPDHTANNGLLETWFFRSAARDWGGVKAQVDVALEFHYTGQHKVSSISLFTAFAAAYTNTALKPIADTEVTRQAKGDRVDSPEGHLSFTVPECFSRADKVVWPNVGVGYFIKGHVLKETWLMAVKVFDVAGADRARLLAERIPADMKVYAMLKLGAPTPVTFGGTEWFRVQDAAGNFLNFYAVQPGRYYQVNITTDTPVGDEPWVKEFFESIRFRP
ncbi:MAG: C1 family peptidase [Candidatus Riflebacteria bacterium]|nr:C1 family peptidase [Candidatus Riflebacteria bacterium]